jgi:hypothetical protein
MVTPQTEHNIVAHTAEHINIFLHWYVMLTEIVVLLGTDSYTQNCLIITVLINRFTTL